MVDIYITNRTRRPQKRRHGESILESHDAIPSNAQPHNEGHTKKDSEKCIETHYIYRENANRTKPSDYKTKYAYKDHHKSQGYGELPRNKIGIMVAVMALRDIRAAKPFD
jgi:hypothetical protein